jgi:prepilin-type N-terminal cleavage/methylation domain-containing protein
MSTAQLKNPKSQNAFTLIELLLVVAVIAILSGVMLSVINVSQQRKIAEDGVKRANLEKAATGVESYVQAEGTYPSASGGVPQGVGTYISNWPNGDPTSSTYVYMYDSSNQDFAIYVQESVDTTKYFKYRSSTSQITECTVISSVDGC